MDSGEVTGSFWETFGGGLNSDVASSAGVLKHLEDLQAANDATVDVLLGADDLIQEYRDPSNTQLRKWLCQEAVLAQCIEFVTQEPPPDASHDRAHKYPFVVSELLACDAEDLPSAIVHSTAALTQFFDFLFKVPPVAEEANANTVADGHSDSSTPAAASTCSYSSCANPVLTGYFSTIATRFMRDFPTEVTEFLRPRSDELLGICLRRLSSRSILDFFVKLTHKIFPVDEGLIMELLSYFDKEDHAADIAIVIDEMLQNERSETPEFRVLRHVSSAEVTSFLCSQLMVPQIPDEQQKEQVVAAIRILTSVVYHCNAAAQHDSRTIEPTGPAEEQNNDQARVSIEQEQCWAIFAETLEQHLSSIAVTLATCADSLGSAALELVLLLSNIASAHLCPAALLESLVRSSMVSVIRHFFEFRWNTILHNAVKQLFLIFVTRVPDEVVCDVLLRSAFEERIVAAIARPREGNFAHMICMIDGVLQWSQTEMDDTPKWVTGPKWKEVVMPKFVWYMEVASGDLGGPPPKSGSPSSQPGYSKTYEVSDGEDLDNFDMKGTSIPPVPEGPPPLPPIHSSDDDNRVERLPPAMDGLKLDACWTSLPSLPATGFGATATDPFAAFDDPFGSSFDDPFAAMPMATSEDSTHSTDHTSVSHADAPFTCGADFGSNTYNPFIENVKNDDPFAGDTGNDDHFAMNTKNDDPFIENAKNDDPFIENVKNDDPFAGDTRNDDHFAVNAKNDDPFIENVKNDDPFAGDTKIDDPFTNDARNDDPFARGTRNDDPFAGSHDDSDDSI